MTVTFGGSGQPLSFNFSAALGLAQQAHNMVLAVSGADVFAQLNLNRDSIAGELPSLALAPTVPPSYSSAPIWKPWRDYGTSSESRA